MAFLRMIQDLQREQYTCWTQGILFPFKISLQLVVAIDTQSTSLYITLLAEQGLQEQQAHRQQELRAHWQREHSSAGWRRSLAGC